MIKTSLIALVTVATVSLTALPAFAESEVFGSGDQDIAKQNVISALQRNGVDATGVDEWDGYVRAYVKLADGRHVMQFFDADTLAPAAIGNSVATDLSY
jgi:hypothetical protein